MQRLEEIQAFQKNINEDSVNANSAYEFFNK